LRDADRGEVGGRSLDLRLVLDLDDEARIAFQRAEGGEDGAPVDRAFAEAPVAVGIAVGILQVDVLQTVAGGADVIIDRRIAGSLSSMFSMTMVQPMSSARLTASRIVRWVCSTMRSRSPGLASRLL
jgi:hypothetical protein